MYPSAASLPSLTLPLRPPRPQVPPTQPATRPGLALALRGCTSAPAPCPAPTSGVMPCPQVRRPLLTTQEGSPAVLGWSPGQGEGPLPELVAGAAGPGHGSETRSPASVPSPAAQASFLPLYPFPGPGPCQRLAGAGDLPFLPFPRSFSPHPLLSLGSAGGGWWRLPLLHQPPAHQLISLTAGGTGKRLSREVGGWGLETRFDGGNLPATERGVPG